MTRDEFTTYYEKNAPGAIKRLMMRGFRPDVAEEAVQAGALAMLEKLEQFQADNPKSAGAYLYVIAFRWASQESGVKSSNGRLSRWMEVPHGGATDLAAIEEIVFCGADAGSPEDA